MDSLHGHPPTIKGFQDALEVITLLLLWRSRQDCSVLRIHGLPKNLYVTRTVPSFQQELLHFSFPRPEDG